MVVCDLFFPKLQYVITDSIILFYHISNSFIASFSCIQDGNIGEENKDYIERDERRLTELGRRTVEIYVLAHIFR